MTELPTPTGRSAGEDAEVVRHEEELAVGTTPREAGSVRVRKAVDTYPIDKVIERNSERITDASERVAASEGDSGEIETLPDGSVSIPVFEEELVVTKRVVVRERVIVRKSTVVDEHRIETDLRRERVDIEADPGVLAAGQTDVLAGNEPGTKSK
jgi:uncharacterized protein (TIGR02271 family)